ncbi:hypothetical protein UVI_02029780 [Ustilaginoidea virens]|nr:hypothetical protein UVI_02029780 [Ustilaginoidea virens]
MSGPHPNPKDSLKSTWRQGDRSHWTPAHWFYEILDLHPQLENQPVPVFPKSDKVPHLPDWELYRWVLFHAALPLVLHQLYVLAAGRNLTTLQAIVLYSFFFKVAAIREIRALRATGHRYGFFDGDSHGRDGVPDVGVRKVMRSLLSTSTFRPVFTVFLAYRVAETPAHAHWWWLPLEAGLYGIVLDFYFYWYHRLMHEVPGLWKFHRTHHLTKHPNPLLSLYADTEQEIFDIAGIPLLTYFTLKLLGCPMGFYEWWVCHQHVVFAELAGHSGVRVNATPPNPFMWLLRLLNAELTIEDHDLHHRKGWKSSGNYGKQTRLWDRIFGTCKDRIEGETCNVDYANPATMPLWGEAGAGLHRAR